MKRNTIWIVGASAALIACAENKEQPVEDPNRGFELSALDSSYAPCDDFFHFTSQGWLDGNPIPETEASWGRFDILARNNQERIRDLFDQMLQAETAATPGSDEQLVGDLYRSGMDSAKAEELRFTPLDDAMQRIDGVQSVESWFSMAAELQMKGVSMPMGIYVRPDDKDAGMNILHITQSGLGLPDQAYYVKTDSSSVYIQEKYVEHIARMFEMYGIENATEAAASVYAFEKSLAGNQMDRVSRRIPELRYNKMSMDDLYAMTPNAPMKAYFDVNGVNTDSIIVTTLDYIKWLGSAAGYWDPGTLKLYSKWHLLNTYASALHHDAVQADFDFYGTVLRGTKESQPRWRRVQEAMGGLSEQIGHLYVNNYFPAEYKARIEQMVEDLRSAFRVRIENSSWMSDETKTKALEKLEAFNYKIGYPDKWKDYSDLKITSYTYVGNLASLNEYQTRENLAKVGQPVDKTEWFMGPQVVNAYYSSSFNEVVFPAGILQPPFFMPEADDAINYGAIGGVIGHEFTHGFDDQGSKYDKDGNLEDWWTAEDRARFEELTQQVVEQYNGYEALPGSYVNGKLTLGENIADLGGLTLAYHAYLKHMEGKETPEPIGGFTDKQRVFLGWAQVWQVHYTDEVLQERLNTDSHSPGEFRVVGPMSNMPEFWDAFGCGPETDMHLSAEKHSVIW